MLALLGDCQLSLTIILTPNQVILAVTPRTTPRKHSPRKQGESHQTEPLSHGNATTEYVTAELESEALLLQVHDQSGAISCHFVVGVHAALLESTRSAAPAGLEHLRH